MPASPVSPIRRAGRPATARPRRLFCLPPAGAGASLFYPWIDASTPDIEVCPVSLPGREDRLREPLPQSIPALADALAPVLAPLLDRSYAILGYSMGALLAYELVLRWRAAGLSQPDMLLALAARAPTVAFRREPPMHLLDKAAFRKMLEELGGTPSEVLANEDAMSLFEPILRNDLRISESYERATAVVLDCTIHAVHCRRDTLVQEADVAAWAGCTRKQFHMHVLDLAHMLARPAFMRLVQSIAAWWAVPADP